MGESLASGHRRARGRLSAIYPDDEEVAAGREPKRRVGTLRTQAAVADRGLIAALRRELRVHANTAKAPAMQAYMKSSMPYYGVNSPEQNVIWRRVFDARVLPNEKVWQATVLTLWRSARFREEPTERSHSPVTAPTRRSRRSIRCRFTKS